MPERERSLTEVAGAVASHLASKGIEVVVVGGSAITAHLPEVYTSHDIDFAVPTGQGLTEIATALAEIGFLRSGRVYASPDSIYTVDFVGDVPLIEQEPIYDYAKIETPAGMLQVYHIEDAIGDRIAAFVHWSDSESLDVAERALAAARMRIDPGRLKRALDRLCPEGRGAELRLDLARNRLQAINP
jgi:predicted nucleotidyltransferase